MTLPAVGDSFKKGCVEGCTGNGAGTRGVMSLVGLAHAMPRVAPAANPLPFTTLAAASCVGARPLIASRPVPTRHSESFASVESVKAASDVYAPLSGKVIETNAKLADDPALVNTGAESVGWFVTLEVADASEASALMGDAAYKAHCDAASAEKH